MEQELRAQIGVIKPTKLSSLPAAAPLAPVQGVGWDEQDSLPLPVYSSPSSAPEAPAASVMPGVAMLTDWQRLVEWPASSTSAERPARVASPSLPQPARHVTAASSQEALGVSSLAEDSRDAQRVEPTSSVPFAEPVNQRPGDLREFEHDLLHSRSTFRGRGVPDGALSERQAPSSQRMVGGVIFEEANPFASETFRTSDVSLARERVSRTRQGSSPFGSAVSSSGTGSISGGGGNMVGSGNGRPRLGEGDNLTRRDDDEDVERDQEPEGIRLGPETLVQIRDLYRTGDRDGAFALLETFLQAFPQHEPAQRLYRALNVQRRSATLSTGVERASLQAAKASGAAVSSSLPASGSTAVLSSPATGATARASSQSVAEPVPEPVISATLARSNPTSTPSSTSSWRANLPSDFIETPSTAPFGRSPSLQVPEAFQSRPISAAALAELRARAEVPPPPVMQDESSPAEESFSSFSGQTTFTGLTTSTPVQSSVRINSPRLASESIPRVAFFSAADEGLEEEITDASGRQSPLRAGHAQLQPSSSPFVDPAAPAPSPEPLLDLNLNLPALQFELDMPSSTEEVEPVLAREGMEATDERQALGSPLDAAQDSPLDAARDSAPFSPSALDSARGSALDSPVGSALDSAWNSAPFSPLDASSVEDPPEADDDPSEETASRWVEDTASTRAEDTASSRFSEGVDVAPMPPEGSDAGGDTDPYPWKTPVSALLEANEQVLAEQGRAKLEQASDSGARGLELATQTWKGEHELPEQQEDAELLPASSSEVSDASGLEEGGMSADVSFEVGAQALRPGLWSDDEYAALPDARMLGRTEPLQGFSEDETHATPQETSRAALPNDLPKALPERFSDPLNFFQVGGASLETPHEELAKATQNLAQTVLEEQQALASEQHTSTLDEEDLADALNPALSAAKPAQFEAQKTSTLVRNFAMEVIPELALRLEIPVLMRTSYLFSVEERLFLCKLNGQLLVKELLADLSGGKAAAMLDMLQKLLAEGSVRPVTPQEEDS